MITVVADNHAILWYLYDDPSLSGGALAMLDDVVAKGDQIAISSIVLAEVVYLVEKGRVAADALDRILQALNRESPSLIEIPLNRNVVQMMRSVDRAQVLDLSDRIVTATVLYLGVPVISRDRKIKASNVTTVW